MAVHRIDENKTRTYIVATQNEEGMMAALTVAKDAAALAVLGGWAGVVWAVLTALG